MDLSEVFKDYKGDPDFKSASAFDPSPANIDKLTLRKKLDLPNGPVQLALLPKATRGNRVQAQMQIQFGTAQDLRGQRVNAAAVADQLNAARPSSRARTSRIAWTSCRPSWASRARAPRCASPCPPRARTCPS